uniref:Uncharacterized protein n=1 Tax=Physcomitrium patens TaxID=3218 RepID=A0A2K1JIQ2_PHYPA|nr:hypothetical protein PHYPA_018802 [Physcomitrium patens]
MYADLVKLGDMQVTTIHFGCISQLQEMHVSIYIDGISSFPKHVHSIRQNKPFLSGPGLCSSFSHCHYRRCLLQLGGLTEMNGSRPRILFYWQPQAPTADKKLDLIGASTG